MSPLPKIDVNIILKLPLWQRFLILGVVWLVLIGSFYWFLYSAKLAEGSTLSSKLERLKNDSAKKKILAGDLPKFKKEKEELDNQLKQALARLPNEKEIANLLESISDAAKGSRLDIMSFKPGKETPKGFYAEVTIDMKVEGGYNNLMLFFEKVAGLPRIVNINVLNIASSPKEVRGEIMLSATFVATTFKFLPQAEAPQPGAKK
ncbi:MAG: type 4a pilus biogenesis protein PilO [Deltaproteobacteria bacterium]|nr:type 4a pilus biogenesis protein PilO [Deltaproteobacteria bacterium]